MPYLLFIFSIFTTCLIAQTKPNIVYILTDDLGIGDIKAYNPNSVLNTPVLNKLCEKSLLFTDMHSAASTCTASRYGIMTGRYSWRTAPKSDDLSAYAAPLIKLDRDTVPALLKRHGYKTALIGKWHLGLNWNKKELAKTPSTKSSLESQIDFSKDFTGGPLELGFDSWYGLAGSLDKPPYAYIENTRLINEPKVFRERQAGKEFNSVNLYMQEGLQARDFQPEYVMSKLTKKAVSFIKSNNADQPFFLLFSLPAPHRPVIPRHPFQGSSRAGIYGDFIHELDWTFGQIIDALQKQDLADNTIIIITADNGSSNVSFSYDKAEFFRHRPYSIYKGRAGSLYEGGHRVPFIVHWPNKIKTGGTISQSSSLNDLYATCADLLESKIPDNTAEDSTSILPLILGQQDDYPQFQFVYQGWKQAYALRYNKWKLILTHDASKRALYDIIEDPSERNNLYKDNQDIVRHLCMQLTNIVQQGRSTPGATQVNEVGELDLYWQDQFEDNEYIEHDPRTSDETLGTLSQESEQQELPTASTDLDVD